MREKRVLFDIAIPTISNTNFGPLVAYLIPGATVLLGLSPFAPPLQIWLATATTDAPTIGGFLYLTVASLAAGMTVSAVRWACVDTLHGLVGLKPPRLDFSVLGANVDAFMLLIEIHYRHYQFYANMFVATLIGYVAYRLSPGRAALGWFDLGVLFLEAIFLAASRDTLRKYYERSEQLLSKRTKFTATHRRSDFTSDD
jgi:hypothetical protein